MSRLQEKSILLRQQANQEIFYCYNSTTIIIRSIIPLLHVCTAVTERILDIREIAVEALMYNSTLTFNDPVLKRLSRPVINFCYSFTSDMIKMGHSLWSAVWAGLFRTASARKAEHGIERIHSKT